MEDFLKQIQLSEYAIKIYLNSLGRKPLSSNELYSMVPTLSQEEYLNVINELTTIGLLIPITPQSSGILNQYLALPPFNPIINYLENINSNLGSIKNQLHQLLANSLIKVFNDNSIIEVDTIFKAIKDTRNDIQEETIIQKQEVEDIVQGMENLRVMDTVLEDLHQTIKGITQTQFGDLIKTISSIKDEINEKIGTLELKKHEKNIKQVIEDSFKKNLDRLTSQFTTNLEELIEEEVKKTIESLNNIIESTFQFRDDFKMLLLNSLNNYEIKLTSIFDLLKNKNESLSDDLEEFQEIILNNLENIIKNSVDSIAALNNPINDVMETYRKIITPEKIKIENIWIVNNLLKVDEEIINLIKRSKKKILFIMPNLEGHLNDQQFKTASSNLKIKIASSEAQTNSSAKQLKGIKNLDYRTLKNENIFILQSDDDYLVIGIRIETRNKLDDFIGFSTNYKPIIQLMDPTINSIWHKATSDLHQAPKSIGISASMSREEKSFDLKIPIQEFTPTPIKLPTTQIKKKSNTIQPPRQEVPPPTTSINLSQQIEEHSDFMVKIQPKAGDEAGFLINNAFNTLIQKLGTLKGEEFSVELQKVADLILENKGFSVTLHKLRSTINQYKEQIELLTPDDVRQIIEKIEEWKSHIL
ncbi:MAG: hypothetical protein ACXACC_00515 [Promethearchaeota archaeon]|jgi:hypothetical protein